MRRSRERLARRSRVLLSASAATVIVFVPAAPPLPVQAPLAPAEARLATRQPGGSLRHPAAVVVLPVATQGLTPGAGVALAQLASDVLAWPTRGAVRDAGAAVTSDPAAAARVLDAAAVVSASIDRHAPGWSWRIALVRVGGSAPPETARGEAATLAEIPSALGRAAASLLATEPLRPPPPPAGGCQRPSDEWFGRFLEASVRVSGAVAHSRRVEALEQLNRECPDRIDLLVRLGEAYLERAGTARGGGRPVYSLADRTLRRALDLDAAHPRALDVMAALCSKTGRAEDAATLLRKALESYPASAAFWSALGYNFRYAGLLDQSIAAYERAEKLDQRPETLIETTGQIAKGLIQLGRYDEASAAHARMLGHVDALHRMPDEKMLFYDGLLELYRGNRDRAIDRFVDSRAVAHTLWSDFAEAYRAATTGDRAAARAIALRLEQEDIVDGERRYRLVHLFTLAGDHAAALRHLAAAVEAGFFNAPYITSDPLVKPLQPDPAFRRILDGAWRRHNAFATAFGR